MKHIAATLVGLALAATTAAAHAEQSAVALAALGSVSSSARQESRPLPGYPVSALRDNVHFGRVLLGYDVAADGTVTNVQVLSAYPVRVFTRSATRAVETWRLAPGTAGPRNIEFTFQAD
jgi:periplasmic protein TonB